MSEIFCDRFEPVGGDADLSEVFYQKSPGVPSSQRPAHRPQRVLQWVRDAGEGQWVWMLMGNPSWASRMCGLTGEPSIGVTRDLPISLVCAHRLFRFCGSSFVRIHIIQLGVCVK